MVFGGPSFGGPGFSVGRGPRYGRRRRGANWGSRYDVDQSNVPHYRQDRHATTSLSEMARSNNWQLLQTMPAYDDGSALDLSGGPFAPGRYTPIPPIVQGQAGYWVFWAATVRAMTRGAQMRPYALTFMQLSGLVPYVHVYPESWRASITSVTPEVHLESGLFNDRFATFSDDPQSVYALLNPRAMQMLIDSPPIDEIWTAGQFVCISRVDPHHGEALGAHLTLLTAIAGGIPTSLFER